MMRVLSDLFVLGIFFGFFYGCVEESLVAFFAYDQFSCACASYALCESFCHSSSWSLSGMGLSFLLFWSCSSIFWTTSLSKGVILTPFWPLSSILASISLFSLRTRLFLACFLSKTIAMMIAINTSTAKSLILLK